MAMVEKKIVGYECERCGTVIEAVSPWTDDYPEGYFITMRRVTENQVHHITDLLYLCSKDCLIGYVTYGISASTAPWRPVARVELSKRRSDRSSHGLERLILGRLPAPSAGEAIPIDPDHFDWPGRGICGHVEVVAGCGPCSERADAPDEFALADPCPSNCGHRWGQHHNGSGCIIEGCPCTAGWSTHEEWAQHAEP